MRKYLLGGVAALVGLGAVAGLAVAAGEMPRPDFLRMAQDHGVMLDANLAGLKSALKLTADQDKLWAPFETSVRDAEKARERHMMAMRDAMQAGKAKPNPVEGLDLMATHMEEGAKSLHAVAAAAKPLYAALDADQQHRFELLGRMMLDHGPGGHGHHHGGPDMDGHDGPPPAPPAAQ